MKPELLLKQQPCEFSTMYIDMNSFFASVEQFYNPELRGKPVGVATGLSGGASIVAASIEAKRLGIKGGVKVAEAQRKCPQIVIIHDSPNSYRAVHRQIMIILHNTMGYVQPKSIDEASILIPSYMRTHNQVMALVKAIKACLFDLYNEHILCSIGVSSSMWLAKMASNIKKPNGLNILHQKDLLGFYKTLKLTDFTGIGRRMPARFYHLGVYSPSDLFMLSFGTLRQALGVNGEKWYLRMRGYEVDMSQNKANKSIGHQITTMPNPPSTVEEVTTYITKIAFTLGKRLRNKGLKSSSIYLGAYYSDHTVATSELKNLPLFDLDYQIIHYSKLLLKKLSLNKPVKKLYVTLFGLTNVHQLSFGQVYEPSKYQRLSLATDIINDKFGSNTLMPLESYFAHHVNLNRVGFAGDIMRESHNPTDTERFV